MRISNVKAKSASVIVSKVTIEYYFYVVITPHNTSYNVKKCSEGFPFERVY